MHGSGCGMNQLKGLATGTIDSVPVTVLGSGIKKTIVKKFKSVLHVRRESGEACVVGGPLDGGRERRFDFCVANQRDSLASSPSLCIN